MDQTIPSWDADLSPEEVKRLSPREKNLRTLTSITRKIEVLEQWARKGMPAEYGSPIPKNRTKLREWKDTNLRLWAWACPQVDSFKGKNDELMQRFQAALRILITRSKRKGNSLEQELRIKEQELEDAYQIIARLRLQACRRLDEHIQSQTTPTAITRR